MMPFCNNLKKGDSVEISGSGRRGVVAMQPSETARRVSILLEGLVTPRYFPVLQLRLVVDGKAETVPPIDGELPPALPRNPDVRRRPDVGDPVQAFHRVHDILEPFDAEARGRILKAVITILETVLPP
jgi:hypothetical protein